MPWTSPASEPATPPVFVFLIQPPTRSGRTTAPLPAEPPAPPWDLVCLHSYLQARTGHLSQLFDARLYADWPQALEQAMPLDSRQVVAVVRARLFEWPAAQQVLHTLAQQAPQVMRVLCGPLASARPGTPLHAPLADAIIAGDPEPALRLLLENRGNLARLRTVPGLALPGQATQPFWWPDLNALPVPAWESLPWKAYTEYARGGVRALVRVSRGHSGQPADRAFGGVDEPFRLWPFARLAAAFGKCAHLGVVETLVMDPPGLWSVDRLREWCDALIAARNTHPWSIQLLPRILSPQEGLQLREAGCRRIELILPSTRPDELARYAVRGEIRILQAALDSMARAGLEVLVRCWVGGPGEDRRERRRLLRLARLLRYPPMRFQPFPLALDSPLMQEVNRDPATPELETWLSACDLDHPPVAAWGGAPGRARALVLGAGVDRVIRQGWLPRLRRLWMQWQTVSVNDELEQRATGLLKQGGPDEDPSLR